MRKLIVGLGLFIIFGALAQEVSEKRIITIDSSGGTQRGNLRFGPIIYEHPDVDGIVSTVSNLTIFSQMAELQAPEGMLIAQAKGERTASFKDGVRVTRGRLEAKGPELGYSEKTGLGLLTGRADIVIEPNKEDEDPVFITTDEVEFDVDTDQSISRGNVDLENGNQSAIADELLFEEDRNLGRLRSEQEQVTITRRDDEGELLFITADEIRVLTDNKRLFARGNVTVVDGGITSTGHTVFFDDEASRAEIIGDPARSIDEEEGFELTGDRLEQRTDIDAVSIIDASVPSDFDVETFRLRDEQDPLL